MTNYGILWITARNEHRYLVSREPRTGKWSTDLGDAKTYRQVSDVMFHIAGLRRWNYDVSDDGGQLFCVEISHAVKSINPVPEQRPAKHWLIKHQKMDTFYRGAAKPFSTPTEAMLGLSQNGPEINATYFLTQEAAELKVKELNTRLHQLMMDEDAYRMSPEYNKHPKLMDWTEKYKRTGWSEVHAPEGIPLE